MAPAGNSGLLASSSSGLRVDGVVGGLAKAEEEAQKKHLKADEERKKREKVAKPVNFKKKAEAKCNIGRSTITDSRYWARVIKEDRDQVDVDKRKACLACITYT